MGKPVAPRTTRILQLVADKPRSLDQIERALLDAKAQSSPEARKAHRAAVRKLLAKLLDKEWLAAADRSQAKTRRWARMYTRGPKMPRLKRPPPEPVLPSWMQPVKPKLRPKMMVRVVSHNDEDGSPAIGVAA